MPGGGPQAGTVFGPGATPGAPTVAHRRAAPDAAVTPPPERHRVSPVVLWFGPFHLDQGNARLQRDGQAVELVPKAFDLLCYMAARPGQLVAKDELLDAVWGRRFVGESVLKGAVNAIRTALGDAAQAPRFVETVSRRGYRFIGQATAAPAMPLAAVNLAPAPAAPAGPATLPDAGADPVVGRDSALAWLQQRWRAACAGQRRVVLVSGEPGVGKTTLVDRFVHDCGAIRVGQGQCIEQVGAATPFLPLLEAIDALCRQDATLPALLRQVAPTCLAQLPWHVPGAERDALHRETQAAAPDRLLREMGELFDRIARAAPLLLVLEDLHWSDPATVQWLDHQARRRAAAGLMVLATFRPVAVALGRHPVDDLRRELQLHGLCEQLAVEGWDEATIATYLRARLPQAALGPGVAAAVQAHTGGLPLFVRSLAEEGATAAWWAAAGGPRPWPHEAAAHWPLPQRLAAVIAAQTRHLPDALREALAVAALCSHEFSAGLVAGVLGTDASALAAEFRQLAQREVWLRAAAALPTARPGPTPDTVSQADPQAGPEAGTEARYTFGHAVYRQAFAQPLEAARRQAWHRRIAQAIEVRCAGRQAALEAAATELAFHAEHGGEAASAAAYCAMAASNALRRTAPRLALALTQRGLGLLAGATGRHHQEVALALLSRQLMACVATQGYAAAQTLATARRALAIVQGWPVQAAALPIWYGCFWTEVYAGQFERGAEVAAQLQQRADDAPGALVQALLLTMAGVRRYHAHQLAEAEAGFAQALALYDSVADLDEAAFFPQSPRLEALAHLAQLQALRGRFGPAAGHRQRLLAMIDSGRHPLAEGLGLWFVAYAHVMRGEPEAARPLCERALARMAGHDANPGLGMHQTLLGWILVQQGEAAAGVALARAGHDGRQRIGATMGQAALRSCAAAALLAAGDLPAARETAGAALADAAGPDNCFARSEALRLLGQAQWRQLQDAATAEPLLRQAVATAQAGGAVLLELQAGDALAELLDATGRSHEAAPLMQALLARLDAAPGAPAFAALRARQARRA